MNTDVTKVFECRGGWEKLLSCSVLAVMADGSDDNAFMFLDAPFIHLFMSLKIQKERNEK